MPFYISRMFKSPVAFDFTYGTVVHTGSHEISTFWEDKTNGCVRSYPILSFSPTLHAQCLQNDSRNTTLECRYRATKGTFYNSHVRIDSNFWCMCKMWHFFTSSFFLFFLLNLTKGGVRDYLGFDHVKQCIHALPQARGKRKNVYSNVCYEKQTHTEGRKGRWPSFPT